MRRALFTLVLAGLGACADNGDQGFVILDNSTVAAGATACTFTGGVGQPFIAQGIIWSGSPTGYVVAPLFQSRLTANPGQEVTKSIEVQGAHISLSVPAGGGTITNPGTYDTYFTGSLAPNGGTANIPFELIPASVVQSVGTGNALVLAHVTPFGLFGGSRIDGLPWQFPVQICTDCVVVDHGPCPMTGTVRPGNPCNPFQDGLIDCCEDTGGLLCPARTM